MHQLIIYTLQMLCWTADDLKILRGPIFSWHTYYMSTLGRELSYFSQLVRLKKAIFEKSCNFVLENEQPFKKKLVT